MRLIDPRARGPFIFLAIRNYNDGYNFDLGKENEPINKLCIHPVIELDAALCPPVNMP